MPTPRRQLTYLDWTSALLPVLLWAGVIFWLSHQPQLPAAASFWSDFLIKKGAHVTVFGILYFLIWRAQARLSHQSSRPSRWLWPWLLTLLYAISDEWHQSFVPGRTPHLRDIFFDMVGASLVAWWLWSQSLRRLKEMHKNR